MFREVELSHESLVPKTLQLDREFILYPNLEFEEVDLGNRRKALRKGEKDQELVYSLDEFIQFAAENKQNLESEFKILELKYTKESFLLDLKQRKALQGMELYTSRLYSGLY
jgi:predicted ATPase